MKIKLFPRMSISSRRDDAAEKNNRIKESLLSVAEEAGAWVLAGGLLLVILKIAALLFEGHLG